MNVCVCIRTLKSTQIKAKMVARKAADKKLSKYGGTQRKECRNGNLRRSSRKGGREERKGKRGERRGGEVEEWMSGYPLKPQG